MPYGDGKSIIEILNIGFEPLLFPEEYDIHKERGKLMKRKYEILPTLSFIQSRQLYLDYEDCYYKWLDKHKNLLLSELECIKLKDETLEKDFKILLKHNINKIRQIYDDREWGHEDQFRNINIFESDLTRAFGCEDMQHSDDIISVVTYYTEIFNSIMHNGFIYKDKKFVFFTAGAGQTRNKKSTFTSEEKLNENFNRFFCGLSRDKVNELGGMNTNKFLAYTSLCQSNTSIWENFDIDRAIVVPDIEFAIPNQKVRYIYTETPEDKKEIESIKAEIQAISSRLRELKKEKSNLSKGEKRSKETIAEEKGLTEKRKKLNLLIAEIQSKYHSIQIKNMDVTIPFTDGFGITFKNEPNAMIRMPFMKGLLSYISKHKFKGWCKEKGIEINKIKDIYGVEHSIDDVDYLFTESQFKMHKYYKNIFNEEGNLVKSGWDVYKEYFKIYGCTANRCNIEKKNLRLNAKTNYQILQTLTTEMTNKQILKLAEYDIMNLNGIGRDLQCMLNILGANPDKNDNLNYFQKSLLLYPEMFKDYYVKTLLKNTKNSMIKKIRSGKFNINGQYTFIVPEPLACLQWWFTGERDIKKLGLLNKGDVHCNLFADGTEVDCLRSPHLDHAHCIRKNVNTKEINSWYKTKALYVGVDDIMSKLLMYDNDGDISLVHNNKVIIDCAKSFQKKYEMIPNYYDMPKANPEIITDDSLYNGIVMAYHHGNIGTPSNEITKIFDTLNPNSTKEEIQQAIEIVALRCCDVNYVIDYAKTLYKPTIPKDVKAIYKQYSGRKVPKFFIYAKDKQNNQVEEATDNNINRISKIVRSNKIVFNDKNVLGKSKYNYKMLMTNPEIEFTEEQAESILLLYRELELCKLRQLKRMDFDTCDIRDKQKVLMFLEKDALVQREEFASLLGLHKEFICDVLIKLLQGDANKDTLWKLFGDIIYRNLEKRLTGTKRCHICGERFELQSKFDGSSKYCSNCLEMKKLEKYNRYNKKRK
jgi:hypothetical protein